MVQLTGFEQPDFNERKSSRKSWIFIIIGLVMLVIVGFAGGSSFKEIEVSEKPAPFWQKVASIFTFSEEEDPDYIMPLEEKDRFDVLILGIRGEDDPDAQDAGALLTDTIMVFSFDKTAKKASIISIPRDLYVKIDKKKAAKINSIFENRGMKYTKEWISKITGVYIDKALVLDFSSFEKVIDAAGGIDITLAKPFEEKQQWGNSFYLPEGENHLDGKNALYYARSRFSSNDFDRSRRQQEVIFALKDKLAQHNWWTDPLKTLNILTAIKSNIQTDINIWNAKEILDLANEINSANKISKYVLSTENLVYESRANEAYILLPVGDNLTGIKQLFQDIIK
ncbi:MAG: LCP family protein [Candidatus Yanofskybacteria bacterium]|nr:LCP family protein [Candidatus Yanofskybacteria bacterium]